MNHFLWLWINTVIQGNLRKREFIWAYTSREMKSPSWQGGMAASGSHDCIITKLRDHVFDHKHRTKRVTWRLLQIPEPVGNIPHFNNCNLRTRSLLRELCAGMLYTPFSGKFIKNRQQCYHSHSRAHLTGKPFLFSLSFLMSSPPGHVNSQKKKIEPKTSIDWGLARRPRVLRCLWLSLDVKSRYMIIS